MVGWLLADRVLIIRSSFSSYDCGGWVPGSGREVVLQDMCRVIVMVIALTGGEI